MKRADDRPASSRAVTAGRREPWYERALGPVPDLPGPEGLDADRRAAVVLWSAAFLLVLLIFRAGFPAAGDLWAGWSSFQPRGMGGRFYWAGWGILLYLIVPVAIVLLVFRESPARYGLRFYLTRCTALIYLLLILVMIPILYWVSGQSAFLKKYPFVQDLGPGWDRIVLWESVYVFRFVCLEFFFRGYLLFGLEEKLGTANAIAVTVVPYSIMHYSKPFPEAFGSIIAGAVLGFVALRTRSIIGGAIIHSTIAVAMDLFALWRKGIL